MPEEPAPPPANDPHRRRFFRLFAGDVASSVGSMLGTAQSLQAESARSARELLGMAPPESVAPPVLATAAVRAQGPFLAGTAGYRAPFRFEDDAVFAWDQRQLPDILQELEITGAADAINAMADGAVTGAAVQAQLTAATLALVAARAWDSRPFARRATIRGSANAFRSNRPASAQVSLALDRLLALVDAYPIDVDGKELADALRREAEEIIIEATEDHGRIAEHVRDVLPGAADTVLHVLTTGNTGAMGSGVFGTALGVITSRHHAGQRIHALVAESRPWLNGARVACWELQQAGVPHALVTDAAAPGCIAAGEVDVVLVTADRIAANGDIAAPVGAYPIALAALAAGVPFIVCVATTAIDLGVADADDLTIEDAGASLLLMVRGMRVAPEGTHIRNPVTDIIPGSVVTAIVTDEGVLRPPWETSLAAAAEGSSARRMAARGFREMVEARERLAAQAAKATEEATAAQAMPTVQADAAAKADVAAGADGPTPAAKAAQEGTSAAAMPTMEADLAAEVEPDAGETGVSAALGMPPEAHAEPVEPTAGADPR